MHKAHAAYQTRATVLKAMAHPARLQMIDALAQGELCVCDLQELVGYAMPTVSRHLAQMKAAGILAERREGSRVYYRLQMPCVLRVFSCVDEVLRSESRRLAQAADLQ